MPLIDMPLAELRKYTGRNPRPDDFDSFWDDSLKELDAVDPRVELTPAEFTAPGVEYFHMQFTGVGGARIYAKLARPMRRDKPGPGLVLFHGYGGQSCSWTGLSVWGMAGFTVAAMDCRGQGGRSQDVGGVVGTTLRGHIVRGLNGPAKNMLFRHVFLDTAQLARLVMQMDGVDPARVGAWLDASQVSDRGTMALARRTLRYDPRGGGMVKDAVDAFREDQPAAPQEVIKVRCPHCKALNDENDKFCGQCGKEL